MTPELAGLLYDPVRWLPAWRGAVLTAGERSAINAMLIRRHALPPWTPSEDGTAEAVRSVVQAWDVLDTVAGLVGCAALHRQLAATPLWTSLSPRVHEFVMVGHARTPHELPGTTPGMQDVMHLGSRYLLGHALSLPRWLSCRVALRYGHDVTDALSVDRSCLWNALKHAKRYPDIRDFTGH